MADNSVPVATLAYLAVFIDGDGYITITRSVRKGVEYFGAHVGIGNTQCAPLELAASIWGGKVYCYEPTNLRHRLQYQWGRQGQSAVAVIEALQPYLLLKAEHALLALEAQETAAEMRSDDPFPWFSSSFDPIARLRGMREEMIGLNQSRNRARPANASGRLLDGAQYDGMSA